MVDCGSVLPGQHKSYEIVLSAVYSLPSVLCSVLQRTTLPRLLCSLFLDKFGLRKAQVEDMRAERGDKPSFSLSLFGCISSITQFPPDRPCLLSFSSHHVSLTNSIFFQQLSFGDCFPLMF